MRFCGSPSPIVWLPRPASIVTIAGLILQKVDWKIGDVRGILEVSVPIGGAIAAGNNLALYLTGILTVLAIIFGLILSSVLKKSILGPMSTLTTSMGRIAGGDYDVTPVGLNRQDEIGDMARTVNVLKGNSMKLTSLGETLDSGVGQVANALSEVSTKLSHNVETVKLATAAVHEQSEAVSTRSTGIAEAVNATAATAEELSQAIGEISQQIVVSNTLAQDAVNQVHVVEDTCKFWPMTASKLTILLH